MPEIQREHSCSFTGHRPEKLPWGSRETDPRCAALKRGIAREVKKAYDRGFRHFLCGMARGTDLYFCEEALALREQHRDITVEAVIPFAGQAERWSGTDQRRYQTLLDRCNMETMIQYQYDRGCMHRRDRYLVDRANLLLAVFSGVPGGTVYTLNYARKKGTETVILAV